MDTDASYHRGRAKHPFYTYLPTTYIHRIRVHMRRYTCDIRKFMRAGGSRDDPDGSHDRPSATGHGTAGLSTGGDHRPLRLRHNDDMLLMRQNVDKIDVATVRCTTMPNPHRQHRQTSQSLRVCIGGEHSQRRVHG